MGGKEKDRQTGKDRDSDSKTEGHRKMMVLVAPSSFPVRWPGKLNPSILGHITSQDPFPSLSFIPGSIETPLPHYLGPRW